MSTTIIAGRFGQQTEVDETVEELLRAGFMRERISTFYMNPPGRHDAYPIGGDHDRSPGAKESDKGIAAGVAAGAAIGVAATPILGPVGPVTGALVGAHLGGVMGGLSHMKEEGETGDRNEDVENAAPIRQAGMMIGVGVTGQHEEDVAVNVLRAAGAADIERAEGNIENGDWVDFNPLSTPSLLGHGSGTVPQDSSHRRI